MAAINSINGKSPAESIAADSPPLCHFLGLPAELRNRIYELAFGRDDGVDDLLHIKPARFSLLLTNSQISAEAKDIYAVARQTYWSETSFKMENTRKKKLKHMANLSRTTDQKLGLIRSLVLKIPFSGHLGRMAGIKPFELGEAEWQPGGGWLVRCCGRESAVIVHFKNRKNGVGMLNEPLSVREDFATQVGRMHARRNGVSRGRTVSMRAQIAWLWKNL